MLVAYAQRREESSGAQDTYRRWSSAPLSARLMLFANTNDATASEVEVRNRAEASAASRLVDNGHLVRLWKPPAAPGKTKALGLYRADSEA